MIKDLVTGQGWIRRKVVTPLCTMGKTRQTQLTKNGEGRCMRPGLPGQRPDRTKASVAARHFYLIIHIIWEEDHYTLFLSHALSKLQEYDKSKSLLWLVLVKPQVHDCISGLDNANRSWSIVSYFCFLRPHLSHQLQSIPPLAPAEIVRYWSML